MNKNNIKVGDREYKIEYIIFKVNEGNVILNGVLFNKDINNINYFSSSFIYFNKEKENLHNFIVENIK